MAQVIPAIEVDESGQRGDLNVFEDFLKSSSAIILRASLSEKAMELPTKSPVSRGDPEERSDCLGAPQCVRRHDKKHSCGIEVPQCEKGLFDARGSKLRKQGRNLFPDGSPVGGPPGVLLIQAFSKAATATGRRAGAASCGPSNSGHPRPQIGREHSRFIARANASRFGRPDNNLPRLQELPRAVFSDALASLPPVNRLETSLMSSPTDLERPTLSLHGHPRLYRYKEWHKMASYDARAPWRGQNGR
ncbi:hypothetical protein PSTG_03325 [Puccinia striiformis f. sp. tritici PST-78]|uniref:Uncharacterized protein n=1 Tax=Puccinia striiformis f. sp. tritici PST-78 TaxID=1165861 RepID=A0A0L0VVQ5_9BASI|nr:hypothetical protein PSTG_03325 [Puccinia striiformis f. sp. tritici PST-78]